MEGREGARLRLTRSAVAFAMMCPTLLLRPLPNNAHQQKKKPTLKSLPKTLRFGLTPFTSPTTSSPPRRMSARVTLSSRSSPSLFVAFVLYSLPFSDFAQLSCKRLSPSHVLVINTCASVRSTEALGNPPPLGGTGRQIRRHPCLSGTGDDEFADRFRRYS